MLCSEGNVNSCLSTFERVLCFIRCLNEQLFNDRMDTAFKVIKSSVKAWLHASFHKDLIGAHSFS